MRIIPAELLPLLTVVLIGAANSKEPSLHPVTVADFAVRQLSEAPSGTVAQCISQAPSLKKDLDLAMSERRSRLVAIASQLLNAPRLLTATRDTVPADVVLFYEYMKGERVPDYLGPDPKSYCSGLIQELRLASDKLLASQLEETVARLHEIMAVFNKPVH